TRAQLCRLIHRFLSAVGATVIIAGEDVSMHSLPAKTLVTRTWLSSRGKVTLPLPRHVPTYTAITCSSLFSYAAAPVFCAAASAAWKAAASPFVAKSTTASLYAFR